MLQFIGISVATIGFLIYLLKLYMQRNNDFWNKRGIKTVENDLTLSQLLTGKKNPLDYDTDYYNQIGDEKVGGAIEFGNPVFLVKDLDIVKSVLIKDFDHFTDRRDFGNDPVLSEALIFTQGHPWKDLRSFLTPTFTSGKIRRMFENFDKSGLRLKEYIMKEYKRSSSGEGFDVPVEEATCRFTVDVIGSAAFGWETQALTSKESKFYEMSKKTTDMDLKKMVKGTILANFPKLATLLGLSFLGPEVNNFFNGILSRALKERESSSEDRGDFLQLLVEAKRGDLGVVDESELNAVEKDAQLKGFKKSKYHLTESVAVAQGMMFFGAGFDTVSNFLNNAIYILVGHPEIQEKVYDEVSKIIGDSGGKVTYEGISKMEYLEMFVCEVMRLYPLQRLERKCVKDYQIPGTNKIVPKDTLTAILLDSIHKDKKYYPDPMKFDPERFNAENKAKRNPYAYMAFGIGPRNCIGMRFALAEVKVALAHLVNSFVLKPSEKTVLPVKIERIMTVYKVVKGLEVRMVPRSS